MRGAKRGSSIILLEGIYTANELQGQPVSYIMQEMSVNTYNIIPKNIFVWVGEAETHSCHTHLSWCDLQSGGNSQFSAFP